MSRRPLAVRRAAAAALVPLALTVLSACGGDDEPTASDNTSSASPSEDATPSESPSDEATEASEPADDEPVTAEGEEIETAEFMQIFSSAFEKATTATMKMTTDAAGQSIEMTGDVDYSTTPMSMSYTMDLMGQEMSARLVDGFMYMQTPGQDKFMKVSLDDPQLGGQNLSDQMDVSKQFATMEKGITKVTFAGEKDGLKEYQLVVDSQTLLDAQGVDPKSVPAEAQIPDELGMSVWFDEDGLYRRMDTDMGIGKVSMTLDDWGKDVKIEAPPANQIVEAPGA